MQKDFQVYAQEHKDILYNYFIRKDDKDREIFEQYLEAYAKANGVYKIDDNLKYYTNCRITLLSHLWDYDSYHMLWNNETHDNLVTHMLAQKEFLPKNFRDLNKLLPNWNHVNSDGNNALHILAQRSNDQAIKQILNEIVIDKQKKNNMGDYYTFTFLKPNNPEQFIADSVAEMFIENPEHFENSSLNKIKEIQRNINNLRTIKIENYYRFKNNSTIEEAIDETGKKFSLLDKIVQYYYLEKTTQEKFNNEPNRKLKI